MIKRQPEDRHAQGMGEQKDTRGLPLDNHTAATADLEHLYLDFIYLR